MKPPPFEYDQPATLGEALALLHQYHDDAKILAGGQSLVPLLNYRLARPDRLVDINNLSELAYIIDDGSALRIGTLTRHSALERSVAVAAKWPLLSDAVRFVGHRQIRNRGTVGGSVAHADPAAELPVAFTALGARFHLHSTRGIRTVGVDDFFVTHLTTEIEPDEMLVEIEVPPLPNGAGTAFVEFAPRNGDFAFGGAACVVTADRAGRCSDAVIALLGADSVPRRAYAAEQFLVGRAVDRRGTEEAALRAVSDIEPDHDSHASSNYRRSLIGELVQRALLAAASKTRMVQE